MLFRSDRRRPAGGDPLATRVLVRGEPVTAPAGRADNFAWPRSGAATIREDEPDEVQAPLAPELAPQPAPARPARTSTQSPATQQQAPATTAAPRPKGQQQQQQQPGEAKQSAPPRRAPQVPPAPPRASNDSVPRPPLNIAR